MCLYDNSIILELYINLEVNFKLIYQNCLEM